MTYRERRSSKRFDCSARLDSSAGLEIFRKWIVNLREPDISTEGGQLVLSCKRICPIINRCNYKIIQLLITPVDYQGSNFSSLVFSASRPSASPSKKQTREMRAIPRKPKFPFFHFVFIQFSCFSSFFNWKSYNAWVWHKVENVDLYLSIKVWMKVRWHTSYCKCWMLWRPHPTFQSSKARWVKPFSENREQ